MRLLIPLSPQGLVVELPDGKLFKLKHQNGRVVEMPNGSVVEMVDGQVRNCFPRLHQNVSSYPLHGSSIQVVEMSNGQQLEMVDGSLIEIRPASLQVSHMYSSLQYAAWFRQIKRCTSLLPGS